MGRGKTRDRILDTALSLFNDAGVAHVSTNLIAEEMEISPGNLYYHFRGKGDLVQDLFLRYEQEISAVLAVPSDRLPDLEDVWFFLHSLFEVIGRYRFIYRNFNDVSQELPGLRKRFQAVLALKAETARIFINGLREAGILSGSRAERAALARNIVLITTTWLPFAEVMPEAADQGPEQAVWQVISLVLPYLRQPERRQLERLTLAYLHLS